MEGMWLVFFWSGPIGLGIGLALIGVFVLLLAKADEISKRTKAFKRRRDYRDELIRLPHQSVVD